MPPINNKVCLLERNISSILTINTNLMPMRTNASFFVKKYSNTSRHLIASSNKKNWSTLCDYFNKKSTWDQTNFDRFTLIKCIYPALIILGIIGNTLSLLALIKINRTTKKSNRNFTFCLATLCFTDLILVLFGCLREYIEEVYDFPMRSYSIYTCKAFFFICYLFSSFASYLYAYIAFERWYAISNPIKYRQKTCTKNRKQIFLIFAFCASISVPYLLFSKLQDGDITIVLSKTICDLSDQYYVYLTLLDALLYCFVPFLITLIFSSLTLINLINKRTLNSSNMPNVGSDSTISNLNTFKPFSFHRRKNIKIRFSKKIAINPKLESNKQEINVITLRVDTQEESLNSLQNSNPSGRGETSVCLRNELRLRRKQIPACINKRASDVRTTIMLMMLPISYLIATFPVFVIITLQFINNFFRHEDEKDFGIEFALSKTLMHINNSFNILFLMLFGHSLRNDLKKILNFKR